VNKLSINFIEKCSMEVNIPITSKVKYIFSSSWTKIVWPPLVYSQRASARCVLAKHSPRGRCYTDTRIRIRFTDGGKNNTKIRSRKTNIFLKYLLYYTCFWLIIISDQSNDITFESRIRVYKICIRTVPTA